MRSAARDPVLRAQALTFQEIDPERADRIEVVWFKPDGTVNPNTAAIVSGIYACPWDGRNDERDQLLLGISYDIYEYLETGARIESLAGMSAAEVRQWLALHQEQLHDCTLTAEQVPGAQR